MLQMSRQAPGTVIDSHHHLWRWRDVSTALSMHSGTVVGRDATIGEFEEVARASGVSASIVVQASNTTKDTDWLLGQAFATALVVGVVGWAPLHDPDELGRLLDRWSGSALVGVRYPVNHPDTVMESALLLADRRLVLECLCKGEQDAELLVRLAESIPGGWLVLDHLGNPFSFESESSWFAFITEIANHRQTAVKLSVGYTTSLALGRWTTAELQPFVDKVLTVFSPSRVLAGSNWPVCLLSMDYRSVWSQLHETLRKLEPASKASVLHLAAQRVYGIHAIGPSVERATVPISVDPRVEGA